MKKYRSRATTPLLLLVIYALLLLTRLVPEESVDTTAKLFFALIILEMMVYALPSFLFCKIKGADYLKSLSLNPFPPRHLGFHASIGGVVLAMGLVINGLFYFWGIGSASYTSLGSFILSDISIDQNPLYVIFAYGLVPAFCEEFLFRGVILSEYRRYSFETAAIISSLAYALSYFDLSGFPFYFLSGLALALVVRISDSVFAAMLTRFAINVASCYLMPPLWNLLTQPLGVLFAIFVAVALFIALLSIALATTEKRFRAMAQDAAYALDEPYPAKKAHYNTLKALSTPTFLLCLLTYVVAVIIDLVV